MNVRDQFRASHAIYTLRRFLDDGPGVEGVVERAIETLIEIIETAADAAPKPESNVTHFYREF